jgi:hypothetical protein
LIFTSAEVNAGAVHRKLSRLKNSNELHEQILLFENELIKNQAERKKLANRSSVIYKIHSPEEIREYILSGIIPPRKSFGGPGVQESVWMNLVRTIQGQSQDSLPDFAIVQAMNSAIETSLQQNTLFQRRSELLNQVLSLAKQVDRYKEILESLKFYDYQEERVQLLLEDMQCKMSELAEPQNVLGGMKTKML